MKDLYPPDGWTEIGPDQLMRRAVDNDGCRHVIEAHKDPDTGEWCYGHVSTNPEDTPHWKVLSEHPLSLHPSIACTYCGNHGHITEGRWKPAARSPIKRKRPTAS